MMSLAQKAVAALDAIGPIASGPRELEVEEGSQRLECQVTAVDSLACGFNRFALSAEKLSQVSPAQLKKIGEQLAGRLNYLLEPIRLIEADLEECRIQMRSSPPQQDAESTSYYELLACRGRLSLVRYRQDGDAPRQTVPAQVTREVFGRLANDFSAAAS